MPNRQVTSRYFWNLTASVCINVSEEGDEGQYGMPNTPSISSIFEFALKYRYYYSDAVRYCSHDQIACIFHVDRHKSVNYDRPGECSPGKDCFK